MRAFNKRKRPKHVTRGKYPKDMLFDNLFIQRDMSKKLRLSGLGYRLLENEWVVIHYHVIDYCCKRGMK